MTNGLSFASRLDVLDISLLGDIESQTTDDDKRSLLALHAACRRAHGEFRWLEIGSHLGGSLQALVRDPACVRIDSIDPRPEVLADERMEAVLYPDNSTERMLELLGALPGADVEKIYTHEAATPDLKPSEFSRPHACFIDGEHTDEACAADAQFCQETIRGSGLIVFHDVGLIYRAANAFVDGLSKAGTPHTVAYLPSSVLAVEIGAGVVLDDPAVVGRRLAAADGVLWLLRGTDRYRALLGARRARLLRKLGLLPREW